MKNKITAKEQIELGFSSYAKAFSIIVEFKMWWIFIFPFLLNLLLLIGGIYAIGEVSDWILGEVDTWYTTTDQSGIWNTLVNWFFLAFKVVLGYALKVFLYLILFVFGGYLTILIMSPVFAWICEKVDEALTGRKTPFVMELLVKDIIRGVLIALRNMFLQILITIGFMIIGLIPVFGWIISLVGIFITSAYFYGFTFMDYWSERSRMSIGQSVTFIRSYKYAAIALGSVFLVVFMIPYFGPLIASFVSVVSIVAATCCSYKLQLNESNNSQKDLSQKQ